MNAFYWMKILRWCAVRMSVTPLEMCLTYGLFSSGIIPVRYARYVSLGLVTFWSILSWLILYWIIIHHDQYRYFSFIHCDRASKAPHEASRAIKPTPSLRYPVTLVIMHREPWSGRGTRWTGLIQDAIFPSCFRSNLSSSST